MSLNQNIRFGNNTRDSNNPESLYSFIKPSRWIFGLGAPSSEIGENEWYYIDKTTGDLWKKDSVWEYTNYSFGSNPAGGSITDAANVGTGVGIYAGLNVALDTILLKSLISSTNKITFIDSANEINIGVNINKSDVGLSLVENIKNTQSATGFSPSAANDQNEGYSIGSIWIQTNPELRLWICESALENAAIWTKYDTTITPDKGYLAARFNSSFNVILNGQVPGLIYQIPHSTDFDFYELNKWSVNVNTGVTYFIYSGSNGTKFNYNLNVDLIISTLNASIVDFDFGIYDNTFSIVVPNSSKNFKIASNSNFSASGYSSIFTPDPGHSYSIVFTFFVPYSFTLNIQDISFVLTEI